MYFVVIGPPGAGKGTQCQRLASELGIPHLSTGSILRQAKSAQTPLGKAIGPALDAGHYIDDQTMIQLVRERISHSDCDNGFILDGFPRTLPQARKLSTLLAPNRSLTAALSLSVDHDVLIHRLSNRFSATENPRPEDCPEAIPLRMEIYENSTKPLVDFYRQQNLLHQFDGHGSPDEVFQQIKSACEKLGD